MEIVSTVAEQLFRTVPAVVERALSLVMAGAGAARVSLAVFSSSRVELVSSCGRALLANGAPVPSTPPRCSPPRRAGPSSGNATSPGWLTSAGRWTG